MRTTARRLVSIALVWVAAIVIAPDAAGQVADFPVEAPPRPLASREVRFPSYEIRTLSNGMQVVTVLHHEQPAVTMRLLVRVGSAQDPERKGGTSNLAAQLLDQGTTTRSALQIAEQIDSIGGALGAGSGSDLTYVHVVVMKDSFGLAMNLLGDVVRNPAFSPEEIDRQKEQVTSTLQVNRNDPGYVASALFDRLVYGFHPYGLPGGGTPESVGSITRGDLIAFHKQHFVPNNMILAIVGDVTSEEAFATAEKTFGGWPRGQLPPWKPVDPPPSTRRVVVVDKPDAVQTTIRVGQLAIPRRHQDYLAFDLAVKILGGEGANRLHRVLRSERGLTYEASADTQAMKYSGDFVAETDTRTETTGEALRLMVEEFSRLLRQRVFERELADAQAYLAGSFPLTIETPNDIATIVLNALFYELPLSEIPTYRERLAVITPDDIQRVARAYVRPDRLSIVLVGNAKAFVGQLRAVGFMDFEIIPIEQLDLMSASLRRDAPRALLGGAPSPVPARRVAYTGGQVNAGASASSDANARALLQKVIEAKGGLAALKAVRTVVADAETTLLLPQRTVPTPTKTYIVYPDKFRVDATVDGQQVVHVYNSGAAWIKDPGGVRDAPIPLRADFAASVRRDTIPMLVGAAEGTLSARLLPGGKARDGKPVSVLQISEGGQELARLFIDDRMLIVGQAYTAIGREGEGPVLREEVFSDYRTVETVRVPFEARVLQNGKPVLRRTLTTVAVNGEVPNSIFARPH